MDGVNDIASVADSLGLLFVATVEADVDAGVVAVGDDEVCVDGIEESIDGEDGGFCGSGCCIL